MLQNSVMILSAYMTFVIAQNYLEVSGVIALVGFGLTVSYMGRPRLKPQVNKFMRQFWELAAHIANTLIFIIVGIVIALKVDFSWMDLLILICVYAGINIIRILIITIFYPIMKRSGYGLSVRESTILSWGGLRGALGLTMALMVSYTFSIPEPIRRQVLFLTAGIVTLTLTINATTIGWLLKKLGLAKIPSSKLLLDYSVKELGKILLIIFALYAPIKVENMILGEGIIRSGGNTKIIMVIDIIGTWCIGIPLCLVAAYVFKWGIIGVYTLLTTEEIFRLVMSLVIFRKRKWMISLS